MSTLELLSIRAADLVVGNVIVDGTRNFRVDKIVHNACSKRGLHVNGKFCYIPAAFVQIHPVKIKEDKDEV